MKYEVQNGKRTRAKFPPAITLAAGERTKTAAVHAVTRY